MSCSNTHEDARIPSSLHVNYSFFSPLSCRANAFWARCIADPRIGHHATHSRANLVFNPVLDIGNPATDSIPVGVRVSDADFDAAARRNAGYQPILVSSLAPAVLLYVTTMCIAIYPIAMRSLVIYEELRADDEIDIVHWNRPSESRVPIWRTYYLMRHVQRQLSSDAWWLAISLLLPCIIERENLTDPSKISYLRGRILISHCRSIVRNTWGERGLTMLTYAPLQISYSLSGEMHTLSKLVSCVIMLLVCPSPSTEPCPCRANFGQHPPPPPPPPPQRCPSREGPRSASR
ncbi:hypothetical protein BD309DRAFT_868788 [Dichomitus squalens]|nr:hypothetical protein BD309DRAFT_868788 [Dichomitus squalens]